MLPGPFEAGSPASSGSAVDSLVSPVIRFAARVSIIHSNRMMAELLRGQLVSVWGCDVVSLDCSSEAGIASTAAHKPDLVLLSHSATAMDSLALLPRLQTASPSTRRLVIAERLTDYLVHRLSRTDVEGVVDESVGGLSNLIVAIERVRSGARYQCTEFSKIVARLRAMPDSFPKLLTSRQESVLVCIAYAMEDREISQCLGMTPGTAQRHRADILRKLGLRSTPKLMRYAQQAGFGEVSLPD